jgi:hypothetical protein
MLLISSCIPFQFLTVVPKHLDLFALIISEADMTSLKDHIPGYGSPSPAESSADAAGPHLRITFAVLILWPVTHYGPVPLADYVSRSPIWTLLASFYQVYPTDSIHVW